MAVYGEYRLLQVPTDIIAFSHEFGMKMRVALGSRASVRTLLELLEIIESSRFQDLPDSWRYRTLRSVDYHPDRMGVGGEFSNYNPWRRQKIYEQTAMSRAAA